MMTLYLTFEALQKKRIKLGQYFPISRKAASQPPTKLDLKAGRKIRIEHAILGLSPSRPTTRPWFWRRVSADRKPASSA